MAEHQVRRVLARLAVMVPPTTSSLVGDSAPAPEGGYGPFVAAAEAFLALPAGARRAFALSAVVVMAAWMFPWAAAPLLPPETTHAEYAAAANALLMGSIVKTGKRSTVAATAATPLEGTVLLERRLVYPGEPAWPRPPRRRSSAPRSASPTPRCTGSWPRRGTRSRRGAPTPAPPWPPPSTTPGRSGATRRPLTTSSAPSPPPASPPSKRGPRAGWTS